MKRETNGKAGAAARSREGGNGAPAPQLAAVPGSSAELPARVREALAADGLSQSRAAREIGISGGALSQWLAGAYAGDTAAMDARARSWLEARDERATLAERLPSPPEWAETPSSKRVISGLTYAQAAGYVAVIHGAAGVGKTMASRRYAGLRPNVWIATMSPWTKTVRACLEQAAGACGLRTAGFRAARIAAGLCARLDGTRGLLAIDEAQHLGVPALEALRSVHDATGCGLALVGSDLLYERLTGGGRVAEFAQLSSRIGRRVRLPGATQGDSDTLLPAWGMEGKAERKAARRIAGQPGGLRNLARALTLASSIARGRPVNSGHIRKAWKDLAATA